MSGLKNTIYENIFRAISFHINHDRARNNEENKLEQYYPEPKQECGIFSNEACYRGSTANDIESIHNGINIKDQIAEYIFKINDGGNSKLDLLMKKILIFRNTNDNFNLTNISNNLIKIIVKVIKTKKKKKKSKKKKSRKRVRKNKRSTKKR